MSGHRREKRLWKTLAIEATLLQCDTESFGYLEWGVGILQELIYLFVYL